MNDHATPPRFTQTPNEIYDRMGDMSESELKVVLAITRQTYGWHRQTDTISISRLQAMTKLSRPSVINGIEAAINSSIVIRESSSRGGYTYKINIKEHDDPASQNFLLDEATSKKSLPVASKKSLPLLVKNLNQQAIDLPYSECGESACLNKEINKEINKDHGDAADRTSPRPEKVARKPRAPKAERSPEEQLILDRKKAIELAYVTALGYTPAAFGREAKAAKWLSQQQYTPEQVIACLKVLQKDDFYHGKHVSLETVAKQIGAWLKSRTPTRAVEYKRVEPTTDRASFAAEARAYIDKIGWRPKHDTSRTP